MKTDIVKSITPNGTWEGAYGLMYKYEILFEGGDAGEYLSKFPPEQQNYFVVGQEAEYERFVNGKFVNIKRPKRDNFQPNKTPFKQDDNRQELIVKQSSLKASIDFCIAKGTPNTEDVIAVAEIFTDWVLEGKKSLPFEKAPF